LPDVSSSSLPKRTGRESQPIQSQSQEAVNAFLADKRSQQLAPDTLKKLENIFQKQLAKWCDAHSVRILPELDLTHLREWRATWEDGPLSAKKKQERLIGFFFFCQSAGWIHSKPAKGLSRIRVKENPKLYFCSWDTLQSISHSNFVLNVF
jgi:integrase/recombinase XerD